MPLVLGADLSSCMMCHFVEKFEENLSIKKKAKLIEMLIVFLVFCRFSLVNIIAGPYIDKLKSCMYSVFTMHMH